jgi:2-haloacid dehalogenase
VFRKYKPHPDTYLGVAKVFDLAPEDVMLVAAHQNDLESARLCGLKTAYIERPFEFGSRQIKDVSPNSDNTLHARDIVELAGIFEC